MFDLRYILHRGIRVAVAITLLAGIASCEDELDCPIQPGNGIAFSIFDEDMPMPQGRSGAEAAEAADACETEVDSLYRSIYTPLALGADTVSCYVECMPNSSAVELFSMPEGRGAAMTAAGLSSFKATALTGAGNVYFKDEQVALNNLAGSLDRFWPDQPLWFFGYATSKAVTWDAAPAYSVNADDVCEVNFSYSVPAPKDGKDAENQPDLIFAAKSNVGQMASVPLTFHHALAAVRFEVGDMDAGETIESIELLNLYGSGSCKMADLGVVNGKQDVSFVWTGHKNVNSYKQAFNQVVGSQGEAIGSDECTFMLVPQMLSDDAVLQITTKAKGETVAVVSSKKLKDIISEFKADSRYVFSIGLAGVSVRVEDKVENNVKKDVTITNTGNGPGYVRAAIVGYWVSSQGLVVSMWDDATQGTFDWGADWGENWVKGNDGFYYHKEVVSPHAQTHPLFNTYTLTASPIVTGSHLELSIIAQIVQAEKVTDAIGAGWEDHFIRN